MVRSLSREEGRREKDGEKQKTILMTDREERSTIVSNGRRRSYIPLFQRSATSERDGPTPARDRPVSCGYSNRRRAAIGRREAFELRHNPKR